MFFYQPPTRPRLHLGMLALAAAVCVCLGNSFAKEQQNSITIDSLPGAEFSGPTAGRAIASGDGIAYAAGGVLPDGSISSDIEILIMGASGPLVEQARLSVPLAHAAAVVHGKRLYLLGGLTPEGPTNQVLALEWIDSKLVETRLPPLPEPLLLGSAAIHRSTTRYFLYHLGGVSSPEAEKASVAVYELPIDSNGLVEVRWTRMPDLPMGARLGAAVAETFNEIVVAGGWALGADGTLHPSDSTWGFARVARDGHVKPGWEKRANLPVACAQSAFRKSGQSHLLVAGGDTAAGRLRDLIRGTKPREPIASFFSFHDPTDVWGSHPELPSPVWGGTFLTVSSDRMLLVGSTLSDGNPGPTLDIRFPQSPRILQALDYAVIGIYFLVVAGIGAWFSRKAAREQSSSEFALGNRKVKWWAASISLFASGVSTISFMAIPAYVACTGTASTGPALFLLFGVLVQAYITFPLLRRLNITSTFEYLEHRFGLILRLMGSGIGIASQLIGRIGIVVMLPALAVSTMTGMNPWEAIVLIGVVTTLYSSFGGFESVIWTDVVQGILMLLGFVGLGVLIYLDIDGGLPAIIREGQQLERLRFFITDFDITTNMVWFAAIATFISMLSFASDQATAQRVLSTPMRDIRKLAYLGAGFSIGVAYLVAAVGILLFVFFRQNPVELPPVIKNDQMVPLFIINRLPVGFAGFMISVLFAAAMSTVSTSVNSCAVMFAEDFYKRFRKNTTPRSEMRVMQIVSLVAGFGGTGFALWLLAMPMPTLMETFSRIMALFGGGFIGVYALGMFTRRTHQNGAIVGVMLSAIVAFGVQYLPLDLHFAGLSVTVVGTCIITGYIASILLPGERKPLSGLTVFDQISDEEAEARIQKASEGTSLT